MATKAKPATAKSTEAVAAASTELTAKANSEIATVSEDMFAADAGQGMEGADAESFAIPFLSALQKGSPTVDEALATYVEGHKAGMLYENITGQTFDGKKGLTFVPCSYRRVFIRWAPRGAGGGFKGEVAPEVVAAMRAKGELVELDGKLLVPQSDGTVHPEKCDRFMDTRNHYILMIDEATGAWREALLSLSSTQIKKSKALMSAMASVKVKGAVGLYTPPSFANVVRITTLGESNDKGTWFGVKMELAGKVQRQDLYDAAKAFHASVSKGNVAARYDSMDDAVPDAAAGDSASGDGF